MGSGTKADPKTQKFSLDCDVQGRGHFDQHGVTMASDADPNHQ